MNRYIRDCCVLLIYETWLHSLIPNVVIQLPSRIFHHSNLNKDRLGKSRKDSLGICVHSNCSKDSLIIYNYCSQDIDSRSTFPGKLTPVHHSCLHTP